MSAVFVVSGPSGVGKSTVLRRVIERVPKLRFSVSHTTRARRPGEVEGVDYFFVDRAAFSALVDAVAVGGPGRIGGPGEDLGDLGEASPASRRDRPEHRGRSARHRDDELLALLGSPDQLARLLTQLPQPDALHPEKV